MIAGLNLQKKAIIVVALILFIILGINTAVLTYIAYDKYRTAVFGKTGAIGEGFQKDLGKVLSLGVPVESLDGVSEKMKELVSRDPSIGYAMVTDPAGKVLFHNDVRSVGKELKDSTSIKAATSDKMLIQKHDNFYDLSFPLLNAEGKISGSLRVGVQSSAVKTQLYALLSWALGISCLCFLLSVMLVSFFISRFIAQPIMTMEKAANRISAGDLTCSITVMGKDEISSLGNAINRMAFNLLDIISKIGKITNSVSDVTSNIASSSQGVLAVADVQKKAVDETANAMEQMNTSIAKVAKNAENLSEAAGNTSSAILQMTASIEKIAENTNVFSETAHETASSIEEMISTIKQIAESLENLSTSSGEIASSIDEVNATTKDIEERATESVTLAEKVMTSASEKGINAANAANKGIENIKNSVQALFDVITMLGKKTEEIGKILNVIDDVADQTNLLALNAAILASKAGEHGKGFSIVADEIKNLAERTSASTSEIDSLIKSVQDVTRSSIRMASDGIHTVDKGLTLVRDVSDALKEIADSSRASTEMARAIQRATAEEALVIKQITDAVEGMSGQTSNIARAIQEQSRGSKFIIEATEKVKDLSNQMKISTNEQKDGSRQIASVTENVTEQASQIAQATGQQKDNSTDIIQSMDLIRSTTGKLISSSHAMNTVIGSLKEEAVNLLTELQKFKI